MLIVVFIAFLLGVLRYRSWGYWKWGLMLLVWTIAGPLLFAGGGTLENPTGDGIITRQIRLASHDGPEVAIMGLAYLFVFYGGVFYFLRRMYLVAKQRREALQARLNRLSSTPTPGRKGASTLRKSIEIAALCVSVVGVFYSQYLGVLAGLSNNQVAESDAIEKALQNTAAELTARGPQKVDPITTLDRVTAQGRTLTYLYELSRHDGTEEALAKFVWEKIRPKVCRNTDMRALIDNYGVTYRYSYKFPDSEAPINVNIDAAACAGL